MATPDEEIVGEVFEHPPLTAFGVKARRRGRPSSIESPSLASIRDSLVWLLEGSWGEIGWALQTARTIEDVRKAFQPLSGIHNYRLDLFVRYPVAESTPQHLRLSAKQLGRMNERIRACDEEERRLRDLLSRATHAVELAKGSSQEEEINILCKKRAQDLESYSRQYQALQEEERALRNRRNDEQAYVAQTELLKFILSGRYSFTPLNVANAIAGLPDMLWRQSSKRCAAMKCTTASSSPYQLFKLVRRAAQTSSSFEEVLDTLRKHLQNSRRRADYVAADLRKNWYYLRAAINAVAKEKAHPRSVPYRVLAEYQRRMRSVTSLDQVLAEEHCLP